MTPRRSSGAADSRTSGQMDDPAPLSTKAMVRHLWPQGWDPGVAGGAGAGGRGRVDDGDVEGTGGVDTRTMAIAPPGVPPSSCVPIPTMAP